MVLAGYSDELEVLGVSTVAGNASIATTTRNGLKILWAAGMQNVPLVKGSAEWLLRDTKGPGAFYDEPENNSTFQNPFDADSEVNLRFEKADLKPTDQNAVHFMYERITAQRPRRVTIFAIGPLTNVALLLKCYPEVQPAIERVVVMGGALGRGNVNPSAEANVWHDPHALQLLLHTRVPLVLVPIDLTQEVPFTEAARAHLLAAGSSFSAFMLRLVDVQQSNHPLDKPFMHDACAVAFAIDALHAAREPAYKSFFECKPMHIVVDTACVAKTRRRCDLLISELFCSYEYLITVLYS